MKLFKRQRKRPIPPGATIRLRPRPKKPDPDWKPCRIAVWTDARGRQQRAPVHADGVHIVVEEARWSFVLKKADGARPIVGLAPDRAAALKIAQKLQAQEDEYKHGTRDARKEKLADSMGRVTIKRHLIKFAASLESRGVTPGYVIDATNAVERVCQACGFEYPADIDAQKVEQFKRDLKGRRAARTVNRTIGHLKAFCRWMVRVQKMDRDPVTGVVGTLNTRTDRKRVRRALGDDEATRLIAAAENGEPWSRWMGGQSISGPDRAMLYRLALGTGFRASELRSLTPESFDLTHSPTITVSAACSKHRREDVQPITTALAERLKEWLRGRPKGELVFTMPERTNDMLQADLAAAGIEAVDSGGRVIDFHALRHTFVTRLARSGIAPAVAKELARHSTITLTMDHYSHVLMSDSRAALDQLPDLDGAQDGQAQRRA